MLQTRRGNHHKYNKRQKIGGAASNKPLVMRNSDGSRGPGSIDNGYYIFDDCETITGMEDVKPDKPVKNSGPAFIWTMVIAILLLAFFGLLVAYCIGTNSTSNSTSNFSLSAALGNPDL